jgi:hypothetical protein
MLRAHEGAGRRGAHRHNLRAGRDLVHGSRQRVDEQHPDQTAEKQIPEVPSVDRGVDAGRHGFGAGLAVDYAVVFGAHIPGGRLQLDGNGGAAQKHDPSVAVLDGQLGALRVGVEIDRIAAPGDYRRARGAR